MTFLDSIAEVKQFATKLNIKAKQMEEFAKTYRGVLGFLEQGLLFHKFKMDKRADILDDQVGPEESGGEMTGVGSGGVNGEETTGYPNGDSGYDNGLGSEEDSDTFGNGSQAEESDCEDELYNGQLTAAGEPLHKRARYE